MIEAAPRLPRCLLWAAEQVRGPCLEREPFLGSMRNCARSVTCARCYRRRGSRRCRAPQNSVKSAAARDAPREGCGGGADECLDW